MEKARSSLIIILLLVCHVVAVLLFSKGFLLRRVVIPEYSNCTHEPYSQLDPADTSSDVMDSQSCHFYPRKFKRVVWLLIDALRYDFVEYNSTLDPVPVYRNKLPFVRDLLKDHPQNTRLFRFVADPPTTTMQRLKALTTGSLPTFIDIGSNFNSYEITEDSLPYQARANRRNLTFIGDDTWLGLYGGMLTKVFEYPSLNVKDLHTVDNGVIEHMVPELEKNDAEFVIGHFLGVDHVGHTYGSTHWSMGEKLSQMNEVLKSIFGAVGEDSIVFVFGDHGMTVTGDHGGETELETTAALLVYTPTPLFPPMQHSGRPLYQIDIVPTVSLLLGIPIPFSNLGMIIPEVFLPWQTPPTENYQFSVDKSDGYKGRVTQEFLSALQINAEQLQRYLKTYVKHSDDFPSNVYVSLQNKFAHAQKLHSDVKTRSDPSQADLTEAASAYVTYMREVKSMCHNVWAKFDDFHIAQGIFLFTLTVFMNILTLFNTELSLRCICKSLSIALTIGIPISLVALVLSPLPLEIGITSIMDVTLSLSFYPLAVFLIIHSYLLIYQMYKSLVKTSLTDLLFSIFSQLSFIYVFSIIVTVGCSVSLVSNSFILYEGDMTLFFIQSLLILHLYSLAQGLSSQCAVLYPPDDTREQNDCQKASISLMSIVKRSWPLVLAMIVVRMTKVFHSCRDLQVGCEITSFSLPFHGAVETLGRLADVRLILSCIGVMSVPLSLAVLVTFSRSFRHLSGLLLACIYSALPLSALCVCGFWFLQSLPQSSLNSLPHWQHVILPRVAYALCSSTVVVCVVAPFAKSQSGSINRVKVGETVEARNTTHQVENKGSHRLKVTTVRHRQATTSASTHDDLKSDKVDTKVSTSPLRDPALFLVIVTLMVAVWQPIALVLNDGVALSAVLLVLQVSLIISALSQSQGTSWSMVVLWGLMCSQFFFGFGHHATVVSLRFDAGFVGVHGEMSGLNLLCGGMLVGLNMLGSQLLFGLGLPLLQITMKPEKTAFPKQLPKQLLSLALQYIAFQSCKTLLTMVTASLQRRHLMVWGVFSPRFLYEAAFQATTDICTIIAYLITSSIASYSTS